MGGIGISLDSQETKSARSKPLVGLPPEVVEHVASKLGIVTAKTKRALSHGEISLPEGVAVTVTRKKNKDKLTIKKLAGGSYQVTHKGKTTKIKL